MPSHQTPAQKKTVERVMHEYKHGELKTARGTRRVKNPKQAIAIALHEAGASKNETPKKNAKNLRHTKAKEKRGETGQARAERHGKAANGKAANGKSKKELYAEAKRRDIPGRSRMSKAQLERAIHAH